MSRDSMIQIPMIPLSKFRSLVTLVVFVLTACNPPGTPTIATSTSKTEVASPTIMPEPTLHPTADKAEVVFLSPPGASQFLADELGREVELLTTAEGIRWERVESFSSRDVYPQTRLVIVLEIDPGLQALHNEYPEVQFLAIAVPGLEPSANLSIIGPEGVRPDQQAFLAGFIATIVTPDYRVGVISQEDTVGGRAARFGFLNGARFFCGLCRPAFPPFNNYPMHVERSQPEDGWEAVLEDVRQNRIETVYIASLPNSDKDLTAIAQSGLIIIGSEPRPGDISSDLWVATVRMEPAQGLRELWGDLLEGHSGVSLPMPLIVEDVNPDLLTLGRQRMAEEILRQLIAGYIDTAVDPSMGEPR